MLEPSECLFDLAFDPNEAANLATDPGHANVLKDMRGRLERWMRETDDSLLTGRLDPWPEMVVNPADDASPQGPTVPAEPVVVST